MGRKTLGLSATALFAVATVTTIGIDAGSAQAQASGATPIVLPATGETGQQPAFISEEIVQAVPEQKPELSDTATADDVPEAASLAQLVRKIDAPDTLSEEMQCLAGAIYFESRGEPVDGQLAVAQVIINRTESRVFPSDYCGVVYQRSQFSFVRGGRMPSIRTGSNAWSRAKKIARIAHEGLWDSEADDALYFHAKYVRPRWSRSKVARATIDSHIFYR